MPNFEGLQERIGHAFQDPDLLRLALTHASACRDKTGANEDNQRLEFLGDAVLQLVLSDALWKRFPQMDEGGLSKTRARLVQGAALAEKAETLGMGPLIIMGHGADAGTGQARTSALEDAFEALVAALYLDGGLSVASGFLLHIFRDDLKQPEKLAFIENPKGELQELLQDGITGPPEYRLISASGPDHDRGFLCAVYQGSAELGRGEGKSKKAAETQAALIALKSLKNKLPEKE